MPQGNPHLCHYDDGLPGDVVYFERLAKDTLRFSVRVYVGRVKGVDAVFVSVTDVNTGKNLRGSKRDSRKLDML